MIIAAREPGLRCAPSGMRGPRRPESWLRWDGSKTQDDCMSKEFSTIAKNGMVASSQPLATLAGSRESGFLPQERLQRNAAARHSFGHRSRRGAWLDDAVEFVRNKKTRRRVAGGDSPRGGRVSGRRIDRGAVEGVRGAAEKRPGRGAQLSHRRARAEGRRDF